MNHCQSPHRYSELFDGLPLDQSHPSGRHKCAGCAYESGFQYGLRRIKDFNINDIINSLPFSQAGTVRHKSPHAAFISGYQAGMQQSYAV